MKKYMLALTFVIGSFSFNAQTKAVQVEVKVGDLLLIGESVTHGYAHIDFPRANFIIKRGGIANYNGLIGEKVVVTEVSRNAKGETVVTLERKNGRKFFRNFKRVNASLERALSSGELVAK